MNKEEKTAKIVVVLKVKEALGPDFNIFKIAKPLKSILVPLHSNPFESADTVKSMVPQWSVPSTVS